MKTIARFDELAKNLTATANGPSWNMGGLGSDIPSKFSAFMNVTAVTGTTPSMTVKFQRSHNAVDWTDVTSGAFSAATAASVKELNGVTWVGAGGWVRYVATISGTTPDFTFDLNVWMHE